MSNYEHHENNSVHIPRGTFNQYFTNIFIKNNNESLRNAVKIAAVAVGKDPDSVDIDEILDKAVYATVVDLYSGKMMDRNESVSDIVRNHIFSII